MAPTDFWHRLWKAAQPPPVFDFGPSNLPQWTRRPLPSDWVIKQSQSDELDITAVGLGRGTLILAQRSNLSHTHHIMYDGAGLTWSKGPLPLTFGGSHSTYDMPGGNGFIEVPPAFDFIGVGPGTGNLKITDFQGWGFIISGAYAGTSHLDEKRHKLVTDFSGTGVTMFVFGVFPPIAVGYTMGTQTMLPGVGATGMVVYYDVVDSPQEQYG
jgi:hypothetical protein